MQRSAPSEGRAVALPPGDVPPELDAFLALEGPQSLLIRGLPGTGKTSLAVGLLERFVGRRLFVTSRVDPLQFRRQFPWLRPTGEDPTTAVSIIDSFGSEGSVASSARVIARAQELLVGPELSSGDPATEFLWLPPSVQEALGHVDEAHPTLLVFDSWDALVEQFLGAPGAREVSVPDRAAVERFLLRRVHAAGAHLVLVVEREGSSHLDYLVDGVVSTGSQFVDERLERWLTLQKLRRVRIAEALYPFTLEGGRFACIDPLPDRLSSDLAAPPPDPAPEPGTAWPGNASFAAEFGRLPLGKLTVLEIDPHLPESCERRMVVPMLLSTLSEGGRVMFTPSPTFRAEEIYDLVAGAVPRRAIRDRLRLFCAEPRPARRPEVSHLLFPRKISPVDLAGEVPVHAQTEEFLSVPAPGGKANLFIDSLANLRAFARLAGTDLSPVTLPPAIQHFLNLAPCAGVVVGTPGDPALDALLSLAGIHVRIRERHGRAIAYGIRPRTSNLVLTHPTPVAPGAAAYELRRVV
jgi:KaiC/GvpD/RAD55 family RecA-like ATPase